MDKKSIVVADMTKSLVPAQTNGLISPLHSALDAVLPLEIRQGTESSGASTQAALVSLLSMIVALQFECLSNDLWYMAMLRAQKMAVGAGVPEDEFITMLKRLETWRKNVRTGNPMSSMF